ncbi:11101_t:CDS:2 [Funneliformis geosporum]|nr:11101_t:CDS:2 [Funneliformis geosporum]
MNIKPLSSSAESSHYKRIKMLEDWKKTLFARTAIDLDLNNEAIILLPLPETESKTHIYKNCCYDYFKKIILKKDSKLLVNDASYLHLYLITHDEMNAFDVKWVQNEVYSRVTGKDNV